MSHNADLRYVSFEGAPTPLPTVRRNSTRRDDAVAIASPACPVGLRAIAARHSDKAGLELARWVLARARLDASAYRVDSLVRRIPACLRALKVRNIAEGRRRIERRPECLEAALSALLIGTTAFFRDAAVFEGLQTIVVPALAERPGPLRIWSAGCASGAELYSFAILLAQAGMLDRAYLLGTDCRPEVVTQARRAEYAWGEAREVGVELFGRYFDPVSPRPVDLLRFDASLVRWRPVERLRRDIHWRVGDALRSAERGPWDVIFWRNTAIYLNADAAARVYRHLLTELRPGGFLVLGKAERPPTTREIRQVHRCIYTAQGEWR